MRTTCAMCVAGVLASGGVASAQPLGGGYGPNGGLMPNIYNPMTQPLSPYLNMFRGANNPASNYYFGARPGTVGGGGMMMGGVPNMSFGAMRGGFFPQMATGPEEIDLPMVDPNSNTALPPAGHPVFYNNTLGYFPIPFSYRGMQGMSGNRLLQQQQQQPAPRKR